MAGRTVPSFHFHEFLIQNRGGAGGVTCWEKNPDLLAEKIATSNKYQIY